MTTDDATTAYGRLRMLWDATADPELVMSDSEVADVETVLQEHAAMTAELERQRVERGALVAGYDKRGHEIAELRRDRDARQSGSGECEGCGCCSQAGCHRFADATCPTDSLGDSVCPCTED